jgi:glutamate-1-semialdehyde 2,1-aminomutase
VNNIKNRYQKSEELLKKALEVIPLGSQTFSKSYTQFPYGVSPYFIDRGKGAYVWDVDGNKYLDLVNGLASVSLGYCDEDVNNAVKLQVDKGATFSLATELEQKLARKLIEHIPSAEMIRFGKNGTDATSGAIRIARAITGKDHVLVCGYHGWQDWYIGSTTKNLGVPEATKELTHHFKYNDLDSLDKLLNKYKDNVAAVIMEPMNVEFPKGGFLENCKKLAHDNNALFIFDETITGFRFSLGGAQKYFGVTPDLSTFGKGMANGYPISALVGKKEYMQIMEDVFLSSTFGGESVSIAASLAVIDKFERTNGVAHIHNIGEQIIEKTKKLIAAYNLDDIISVHGHPCWSFLVIKDYANYSSWDIKTLFMQECLKRGLLTFCTHNISYAYSQNEVDYIENVYREVLPIIKHAIDNNNLYDHLLCEPLKQLFKVREV